MIDDRPLSADRVPTLTEVVELDLLAKSPATADRLEDDASPGEADLRESTPAVPPEVTPADALAVPEAEVVAAAVPPTGDAADVVPPAMVDDFVLAGLDAEDALAAAVEDGAGIALDTAGAAADVPVVGPASVDLGGEGVPPRVERLAPPPVVDVDAVVGQVLSELMPRIDMLLESRLREALAPALARAADGLIRDTRVNLSVAVRELVQETVDRALQRRADE